MPDPLLVPLQVALEEKDRLLLTDALAPGDSDEVGLLLTVELMLRVLEGVDAAEPVPELL